MSHELLGWLLPDGRHCDDPSDIRVLELRTGLVAQLLEPEKMQQVKWAELVLLRLYRKSRFLGHKLLGRLFCSPLNLTSIRNKNPLSEFSANRELTSSFIHWMWLQVEVGRSEAFGRFLVL